MFSKLKTWKTGSRCVYSDRPLVQWSTHCLQRHCLSAQSRVFSVVALPPPMSLAAHSHPGIAIHSLPAVLLDLSSAPCWKPEQWKQQPSPGTAPSGFTSEARKSWSALRSTLFPGWMPASVLNCKIREDHSTYAKPIYFWWESKHSFKVWKKNIRINLYLTHDNSSCCVLWQCTLPMECFLSLDAYRHCVYRAREKNGALFYCLL